MAVADALLKIVLGVGGGVKTVRLVDLDVVKLVCDVFC